MQIAGSTTVITGGASGLGRATAERLHAAGGAVVLLDLARSAGKELAAGLGDAILFCTRDRLVAVGGAYGLQPVMHAVTPIGGSDRYVLGVPFHEYR